jgi:hypothetical protein
MAIQGIYPYYLRTTTTADGTGYPTLDTAKAALKQLITLEQGRRHNVSEQANGRWISHQQPTGSVVFWIEDDTGNTVRVNAP